MFRCFFHITDSTNTQAKIIINRSTSLPDSFSIVSIDQSQSRGKWGSVWKSSVGNLHLSICLNLDKYLEDMKNIGLMSIVSSIAVRETLQYFVSQSLSKDFPQLYDVSSIKKHPKQLYQEKLAIYKAKNFLQKRNFLVSRRPSEKSFSSLKLNVSQQEEAPKFSKNVSQENLNKYMQKVYDNVSRADIQNLEIKSRNKLENTKSEKNSQSSDCSKNNNYGFPVILSKWPNDILVMNKKKEIAKIAGILLELEKDSFGLNYLIIGIGVNLATSPIIDKYKTTSLFDIISKKIDILEFADILENKILLHLEELKINKENIVNKFKENLFLFNKNIQIKVGDNLKSGIFSDISKEGYLILKDESGNKITITAGEIFGF